MGGECNYLLRVNPHTKHLEFVPDEEWMTPEMLAWDEEDIKVNRHCSVSSHCYCAATGAACVCMCLCSSGMQGNAGLG
jgi:hypothetical protein